LDFKKVKVFISWSGPSSKAVAEALHEWLKLVLNKLEPWISSDDIDPGTRWSAAVAKALSESKVGIICLTPENTAAPWILFEAGALAKTLEGTFVCPYVLFDLKLSNLPDPLKQFQALKGDKEGTRRLVDVLNKALGRGGIDTKLLDHAFKALWPDLNRRFRKIQQLHQELARKATGKSVSEMTVEELYLNFKDQPAPFSALPSIRKLRKQKVRPWREPR